MPGLLDIEQNPLFNIGLGLLQGGGPNNPNQWAGGLNQGLLNLRGANQQRQQQELLDMRKSSYEADERYRTGQANRAEFEARYKRAQQAAEAQRNEQFIQSLPPEQQQIARAMGVGNFAKMQGEQMFAEPEKGTSAMQEYAQAQAQGFQGSFIDYQTMMKKAGSDNITVNSGSDFKVPPGFMRDPADPGRVLPIPGGPKDLSSVNREYSDTQTQAGGYGSRMEKAEDRIKATEKAGFNPGGGSGAKDKVLQSGGITTNWMRSEEGQVYEQAQHDWVRAKLRKESGAVIADEEMEREIKTYFPQPGDSDAVIKAKAESRKIAIEAMKNQAAGGAGGNSPNASTPAEPQGNDPLGLR